MAGRPLEEQALSLREVSGHSSQYGGPTSKERSVQVGRDDEVDRAQNSRYDFARGEELADRQAGDYEDSLAPSLQARATGQAEMEELRRENLQLRSQLEEKTHQAEVLLDRADAGESRAGKYREMLAEERRRVVGLSSDLERERAKARRSEERWRNKERSWEKRELALVELIEDLRRENNELRNKVSKLEAQNDRLLTELERQEQKVDRLDSAVHGLKTELESIRLGLLLRTYAGKVELSAINQIWPGLDIPSQCTKTLSSFIDVLLWVKDSQPASASAAHTCVPVSYKQVLSAYSDLSVEKQDGIMGRLERLVQHERFRHLHTAFTQVRRDSQIIAHPGTSQTSGSPIQVEVLLLFCKEHMDWLVEPLKLIADYERSELF